MNNKKSRLSCAIKVSLFATSVVISTQAQALSIAEPPVFATEDYIDYPLPIIDEVFITADADGNRQLSVDEFYSLHAAAAMLEYEITFKRMDSDGSGDVSADEFIRFLPVGSDENLKARFLDAAGEDEMLDVKEFSVMRMQAQDNSNSLLWKFAAMDYNHDGELNPAEFYGKPHIEPPAILLPPEVIDPIFIIDPLPPEVITPPVDPEPEVVILPVDPEPEIIIDPVEPPAPPIAPTPEKPEQETEENEETTDNTSPAEPAPELLEKIDRLQQKLAMLEKRMGRVEKSINRTQEKLEKANSDRKASRLERRLKRQTERLNKVMGQYEETMMQLQEAQRMLNG